MRANFIYDIQQIMESLNSEPDSFIWNEEDHVELEKHMLQAMMYNLEVTTPIEFIMKILGCCNLSNYN